LLQPALQAFDRRLNRTSRAPLVVAFSGGGDSLALLLMAKTWADRAGRSILALTVDHGLQPQSAAWTQAAARVAARLGADFRALEWKGQKPVTGLPAAAREARHRLIAEAARQAGAGAVLVGHTLDDQFENALMRAAGERVGVLREWSASPVWPEGRGLFHFRPLLAARRADLRVWLEGQGLPWIDDPANDDVRSPRARARARLAQGQRPEPGDSGADDRALRRLASMARVAASGAITVSRDAFTPGRTGALRLLQIVAACAAGRQSLARPERARAILRRLEAGEAFVAALGGARLEAGCDLFVAREAGEFRRGLAHPVALAGGRPMVWDGRFELTARRDGLAVGALVGSMARLEFREKSSLSTVPAAARGALPTVFRPGGAPTCPILARDGETDTEVTALGLVEHRFRAACGLIDHEDPGAFIADMANGSKSSYVGV
jgi:tRNA(Ile)-lysidine synthase